MLSLIGLGLYDEKDISVRGLEEAQSCDRLYLERYTSRWRGLERLERKIGKDIKEVERNDLEERIGKILEGVEGEKVGILIPGDPLVATTHVEILIQAKKHGIETKVIHAPSIYSAAAETGLQIYKFGKTTTIPFPQEGYRPQSPYDVIKENKESGLHTLALLDIKDGEAMETSEALSYLLEIEEERCGGVVKKEDKVAALSVGAGKSHILYGKVRNLLKKDFSTPAVLLFPGRLHDKEREALELNEV